MKRLIFTTAVNTEGRTVKDSDIFNIARSARCGGSFDCTR